MVKAQILMHRYFDAAWNQGRKGLVTPTRNYQNTRELIGYVFDLEQRLAAAEAKIPRWIPVGESMPTIAEPYVEYGEWVLGKERYYKKYQQFAVGHGLIENKITGNGRQKMRSNRHYSLDDR